MANTKHNCNMSLDEILNEDEPAEVTTLYGGKATQEELEAAFDEIFKNEWRKNK